MPRNGSGWSPQSFRRFAKFFPTSLCTALIETDIGLGYMKGLGNPEGPHCLACEVIGTSVAEWFEAPTLDWAFLQIQATDVIPIKDGQRIQEGPSFITRAEPGAVPWGGDASELTKLSNPKSIIQLVILDTWLRNCDRYAPDGGRRNRDNVLFVREFSRKTPYRLVAMDFTHAFTCGHKLNKNISQIDYVRDERIYGLFPEFQPYIDRQIVQECAQKLQTFDLQVATEIVARVPVEWDVSQPIRSALINMLVGRARFLATNIEQILLPQQELQLRDNDGA